MKFNIRFKSEKSLEKILTYIGWVIFAIHMVIANIIFCSVGAIFGSVLMADLFSGGNAFIINALVLAGAEWGAYVASKWIGEEFIDISFSILAKYCEDEEADEIFIDNPEVI